MGLFHPSLCHLGMLYMPLQVEYCPENLHMPHLQQGHVHFVPLYPTCMDKLCLVHFCCTFKLHESTKDVIASFCATTRSSSRDTCSPRFPRQSFLSLPLIFRKRWDIAQVFEISSIVFIQLSRLPISTLFEVKFAIVLLCFEIVIYRFGPA